MSFDDPKEEMAPITEPEADPSLQDTDELAIAELAEMERDRGGGEPLDAGSA